MAGMRHTNLSIRTLRGGSCGEGQRVISYFAHSVLCNNMGTLHKHNTLTLLTSKVSKAYSAILAKHTDER